MKDLIGEISDVRVSNNGLWMQLLDIALRCDPDRAKDVLRKINSNDRKIAGLLERLAK